MKRKLTFSLLLSLFTGIAMHASDAHKQTIIKNNTRSIKSLVKQRWPEAKYIVVLPFADNFPVVRVFFKETTILPVMEDKKISVFKYQSAHYYLTSTQEPASLLHHKRITRRLTQLTLTPNSY